MLNDYLWYRKHDAKLDGIWKHVYPHPQQDCSPCKTMHASSPNSIHPFYSRNTNRELRKSRLYCSLYSVHLSPPFSSDASWDCAMLGCTSMYGMHDALLMIRKRKGDHEFPQKDMRFRKVFGNDVSTALVC